MAEKEMKMKEFFYDGIKYIACMAGAFAVLMAFVLITKDNVVDNYNERTIYCIDNGYKGFIGTNDEYNEGNCYRVVDDIIIIGEETPNEDEHEYYIETL